MLPAVDPTDQGPNNRADTGVRPPMELNDGGHSICLVGGTRIIRCGLRKLLESSGFRVVCELERWAPSAARQRSEKPFDAIVLLPTGEPFATFHQVRETLRDAPADIPLVVLAGRASRGQVYAALRTGARAYVNLDADPEELVRAIRMAAAGKVHLSPDVAQLLVDDLATATEPAGAGRLPRVELSQREMQIVQLLCEGLTTKGIARQLHVSPKTVENHRYNIYRKCEVDSIAGLMRHAIQRGLVAI